MFLLHQFTWDAIVGERLGTEDKVSFHLLNVSLYHAEKYFIFLISVFKFDCHLKFFPK